MIFSHPAHEGRRVRLAYCHNLHAADTLDEMLTNMRAVTLPLRERVAPGMRFGVGLWLGGTLARALASKPDGGDLSQLFLFFEANDLDPFTYNAFPHGRFHQDGLKADVFKPTWKERERVEFTLAVARAAVTVLARSGNRAGAKDHISISTHTGMYGAWLKGKADLEECVLQLARVVDDLARMEEESGVRVVLALEPEPQANASTGPELAQFLEAGAKSAQQLLEEEKNRDSSRAAELLRRHLGWCLDACHSAVAFEDAPLAPLGALTLGKVQYANAIEVRAPASNPRGVQELLDLDEPRYLHQVAGLGPRRMQAADLSVLRAELDGPQRADWMACDAWRCHYHVPVDLETAGAGLRTTRASADALLEELLIDPSRWSTNDLHLEIETYTWDVLPGHVRGPGALVDGLEREYRHVIAALERAGWRHAR
jgi:hypothetical protein